MMEDIFKAAETDSFWGINLKEAHTMALTAGYICSQKEFSELFDYAKGMFFISPSYERSGIIRRTKDIKRSNGKKGNYLVDLAIALGKGEEVKTIYTEQ